MKRIFFSTAILLGIGFQCYCQKHQKESTSINQAVFQNLKFTEIKGAPKLGMPKLVLSEDKPVFGAGLGWAAPTFYDYDGDSKNDLLIGEFGSGVETGNHVGHFIRVYRNIGTAELPRFADNFTYLGYASDWQIESLVKNDEIKLSKYLVKYGTPISIPLACCMAFKPQFADLNGDGYPDLYSGTYESRQVYWFRGSSGGFLPGETLQQYGDPSARKNLRTFNSNDPNDSSYWIYSAISFGEFTGDDLPDMIVGGRGLRISKNIGSKTNPEVGLREVLIDPNGKPLWDNNWGSTPVPYVVDWDQDGILDLLVTNSYSGSGNFAVMFFKGMKKGTSNFERGVSLFTAEGDKKAFPGGYLNASVGDWNNDGVNDLLIGARVVILNGKFDQNLNWGWEKERGYQTSKGNPGYLSAKEVKQIDEKIRNAEKLEKSLSKEEFIKQKKEAILKGNDDEYKTKQELVKQYYCGNEAYKSLIHQGYVYVMLGQK